MIQLFLDYRSIAALAVTILAPNLLTSQGSIAFRAPIHRRHFAVCQIILEQLNEIPLCPMVIFRVARCSISSPIPHGAHTAQLTAHTVDIGISPLFGVDFAFYGCIFRRQTKGIKTDGEHDIETLHAQVTSTRITGGHGIPMTDVQISGWIRQHRQGVIFRPGWVDIGMIQTISLPFNLPSGFDLGRVISFRHTYLLTKTYRVPSFTFQDMALAS